MHAKVSARSDYKEYMRVTVEKDGQALLGDLFPCYGGEYFTEDDANSTSEIMLTFEAMKNGECGNNPDETYVWIKPLEVVVKEKRAKELTAYDWDHDRVSKARHESHLNQATIVIRRDFDWKRDEDGQLITPMSSGDRFFHCLVTLPCQHWDHPERSHPGRFSELNFDVFNITFKTTAKQYRKFPHREIAARALNNALKLLAAHRA